MKAKLLTQIEHRSDHLLSLMPISRALIQRKCAAWDCGNNKLMQSSEKGIQGVPPIVHEALNSPGKPLDAGTRTFMEQRFGHDFSRVQVHTDKRAAESARAVHSLAYTVGRDIVFGERQFAPSTDQGLKLIAHELTHVIQQKDKSGIQRYPDRRDSISQEATLTEARGRGETLGKGTLERMDINTLMNMSDGQRYRWYLDKLGRYQNQIDESATNHNIPPQLLAAVILNELADINVIDTLQEALGGGGSLGIAQVQVDTAIRDRLVHMPGDEARLDRIAQSEWETEVLLNMDRRGHIPRSRESFRRQAEREMVVSRLSVPQYAIEASAREIRVLLNNMVLRRGNPWQSRFGLTLTDVSQLSNPNDIYGYIDGPTQLAKEENLAEMITAAYNSPGIIDAVRQESITEGSRGFIYSNARIHGSNSRSIAGDLYIMALFHSFSRIRRMIDVQPKSLLPEAGDIYENEADSIAEHIMQGKSMNGGIGRAGEIETPRTTNEAVNDAPSIVHEVVQSRGEPLDEATRTYMEPRFGYDFKDVRIHASDRATESSLILKARAYTVGNNIVFGEGQFAPGSDQGRRLLAHELTHVVQQQHHMAHPIIQRDGLSGAVPETRSYDELWREFQRYRMQLRDQEALALVPDILRQMSGDRVRNHGIDLSLWLMDQGQWSLARQALQQVENLWRLEFRPGEFSVPMAYSLFSNPNELVERAETEARAGRHEHVFRLLGLGALFAQMQLNLTSLQRERRQRDIEGDIAVYQASPQGTSRQERILREQMARSMGQIFGMMGRIPAYSELGGYIQLLRAALGLYPRLEREAITSGDSGLAAEYRRRQTEFRGELLRRYTLPDRRAITMESTLTEAPRGGMGYTIHGVNDREEIVTPLPGTRRPEEMGFFPTHTSTMEQLIGAVAGQEEIFSELYNTPEFRREFGDRRINLNNLQTRVRVWEIMYRVYVREHGAGAFEAIVRLMERYLRNFTMHTEYNIRDFGVNYLSTTFPEDLAGRSARDCGVYALTVAYEIYRVARSASPRLPIDLTLYTMQEHATLVIRNREENKHFIVSNDQIMGPYEGDVLPSVARAFQGTFGREFSVAPTVGVPLPPVSQRDQTFRSQAWRLYQASTGWGLQTEQPTGPDDTRTEAQRTEDTYRHYYENQRLFNTGNLRLRTALNALPAEIARPGASEQTVLSQRLGELTATAGGLAFIFESYGTRAPVVAESQETQRLLPRRSEYIYTLPPGETVHPLARFGRALLRFQSLGGNLTQEQQVILTWLDAIPDFKRTLDQYRQSGIGSNY